MGIHKIGDQITLDFLTHNPFTGTVQDADSLPTCEVFEDENDSPFLLPIVTKRTDKIGDYRISILTTTEQGFEVGKSYNVIVSVSVCNTLAKARIGSFTLDSKRTSDLADLSLSQIETSAVLAKEETVSEIRGWVAILKSIGTGRWIIQSHQLKIYDEENKLLLTFDLKSKEGTPASENVYERVPVD